MSGAQDTFAPTLDGGVELEVRMVPLGAIQTNCFIAGAAGSGRCVIIDPGAQPEQVLAILAEERLTADGILITHGHFDHLGAVAALARELELEVWMPEPEAYKLERLDEFGPESLGPFENWRVDHDVEEGDVLELGGLRLEVLSLPGHSPAHVAFLAAGIRDDAGAWTQPPMLFSGDVLFEQSVGRTDTCPAPTPRSSSERSPACCASSTTPRWCAPATWGSPPSAPNAPRTPSCSACRRSRPSSRTVAIPRRTTTLNCDGSSVLPNRRNSTLYNDVELRRFDGWMVAGFDGPMRKLRRSEIPRRRPISHW